MKKRKNTGLLGKLAFKLSLFFAVFLILVFSVLIIGIVSSVSENGSGSNSAYNYSASGGYPETVEAYRPLIIQLCEEYNTSPDNLNLPDYVNAILALIQIESGGQGTDPMQASECSYNTKYPHTPNGIQDAEYSCRCGVQYARDAFILFKVEGPEDYDRLAAAVQGYNFGITGWHNWISARGGKYTVALAQEYSNTKMPAGAKGTPTHGEKFLKAYKSAITSNGSIVNLDDMVYYKQWDERWASYPYGSSTIQNCGCGVTCMAMCVATFCDSTVTPPTMADLSMKKGGYVPGAGSSMPVIVEAASKIYKFNYKSINADEIISYIQNKKALIIWGCNTGYFSSSSAGHVMIIRGANDKDELLLADPNREENNSMSFSLDFIKKEAKGYYIAVWAQD